MIERVEGTDVFLFNPLPWERDLSGVVPESAVDVRGDPADPTASRHFQDRAPDVAAVLLDESSLYGSGYVLEPTTVPGYGYATVSSDALVRPDEWHFDERAVVETDRYVLKFDRDRGGIASWYDKDRDCEWIDRDAANSLGGFVHERVADDDADDPRSLQFRYPEDADVLVEMTGVGRYDRGFQPDWRADRTRPDGVARHRVYETPLGYDVRQRLTTSVTESDIVLRVLVPDDGETVTVEAAWLMGLETHPEATYLAFPFAIDDPTARVDVGGQAMHPGADQLPETCHDYYTAQRWVDVSGPDRGMTVACPLNPLVQFGDFHYADNRRSFELSDAHVLSWVTNNYWETNFRAHQPGPVCARYRLRPYDAFDEADAHRTGLEAEHHTPLAQTLGDRDATPTVGRLLDLPEPPVLVTQIRPVRYDEPGEGVFVLLRNADDDEQTATIESDEITIAEAERATALGGAIDAADGSSAAGGADMSPVSDDAENLSATGDAMELSVTDGTVELSLSARENAALRMTFDR